MEAVLVLWMTSAGGAQILFSENFGGAGAAANFTLFSYDGQLGVGINVDPAAVTDPALLVESLRKGFDEVLTVV